MKLYRTQVGTRSLIGLVGLCALLSWAIKVSIDSRPSQLYSKWLIDGDSSRRFDAAHELGNPAVEPVVAVPALVRALRTDPSDLVREQSARSLSALLSEREDGAMIVEVTPSLVEALADRASTVRAAAADALGRFGLAPEATIPALILASRDDNERVRGAAIVAIGLIQKKAGVDLTGPRRAIAEALNDPSEHVREMGLYSFWASAEKSPAFSIALLKDQGTQARRGSMAPLARNSILASQVVPELTGALADPDPGVRAGAAKVLKVVRPLPLSTVAALEQARGDPDEAVREAAVAALWGVP